MKKGIEIINQGQTDNPSQGESHLLTELVKGLTEPNVVEQRVESRELVVYGSLLERARRDVRR